MSLKPMWCELAVIVVVSVFLHLLHSGVLPLDVTKSQYFLHILPLGLTLFIKLISEQRGDLIDSSAIVLLLC